MEFYESVVLTFFDAVMTLLFVHNIKKNLENKLVNKILFIMINGVTISLLSIQIDNRILSNILCTITLYIILSVYLYIAGSKKHISNILVYFAITILIIIVQLIVVLSMNIFLGSIEYSFTNGLIAQFIGLVIVLIVTRFVPLSHIDILIEDKNTSFRIIISLIFILYYSLTILWLLVNNYTEMIFFGVMVVLIFAMTIMTIILREGYLSSVYQEKLSLQETYFPIIDDMIQEIRNRQHDYHNQVQTILAMKRDTSQSDEAINDYAINIIDHSNSTILTRLENRIIAAFLYSKINEAYQKGIDVTVDIIRFSNNSTYETYQLIEMYGILLDNAIEAIKDKPDFNEIEVKLDYKDKMNVFEVRNDYEYISISEINNFFKNGYTMKQGKKRGIGLYKIKKMVKKNDGFISFFYDTEMNKVVASIHHR